VTSQIRSDFSQTQGADENPDDGTGRSTEELYNKALVAGLPFRERRKNALTRTRTPLTHEFPAF